ncbi:AsmA family protein [Saccharibacter sp. 17.LH.SD]|uniref:AsmA family protein n=1 Tax=Saccharibacter sp. 17.LH.SD TaxID=2689393 RepID=UPI00136FC45C|nr:AsmA family protein [Saccharibacter sp. 17.LH.SD]MXV43964.1 AsmA family protein [Saccharibacter sp. 17.LH.SD]
MKKLVGVLIALVVALLGVSIGARTLIDQKVVKKNLMQAFRDQSGLELTMDQVAFQVLPWPSFHATNVVLTRPGCTPFVSARSVHADISLLALLHRELSFQDFTADGAHIVFHRTREGRCSTWLPFKTDDQPETASHQVRDQTIHAQWKISFAALHMSNADVSWQDDHQGDEQRGGFAISSFDMMGMRSDGPWIDLKAQHDQTPFRFRGRIGPTHRVLSASAKQDTPWGFSFGLTFGPENAQDQMVIDGTMMDPHRLRGVRLSLQGHWEDLKDLEGLFPHLKLPDVGHVSGMADLREKNVAGANEPHGFAEALRSLPSRLYPVQVHLQLGHLVFPPGTLGVEEALHLRNLQVDGDAALAPLMIQGDVDWGRFSWTVHADFHSLEQSVMAWMDPGKPSVPLTMQIKGRDRTLAALFSRKDKDNEPNVTQDGVHLDIEGTVGRQTSTLSVKGGADMLQLPEFPGVGKQLSGAILHNLFVQNTLSVGPLSQDGLTMIGLRDVHFESQEMGGVGSLLLERRVNKPSHIEGSIHFSHLNGDALAVSSDEAAENSSEGETALTPVVSGKNPDHSSMSSSDRMQAFLKGLHEHDLMLDIMADQLHVQELDYHDVHIKMTMGGGRLSLDPVTGTVEGVPLMARVAFDNTVSPSRVHIEASPLIVPSSITFRLLGQPAFLSGPIQWDGILDAQGINQESFFHSLNGTVGLSLVKGEVKTATLVPLAGPVATFLKLGDAMVAFRCAAMHMDVHQGMGTVDTLGLQNKHLALKGSGTVNLNEGSLALDLHPRFTFVGNSVSLPIMVTGSWMDPKVAAQNAVDGEKQLSLDGGADDPDLCQPLLQKAREGHNGLPIPAMQNASSEGGGFLKALGIGGKP